MQNGAWEIDKNKFEKFNFPSIIQKCMDDFASFYLKDQKTHKLNWVYGNGTMEIKYTYMKKPYQSVSTLLQYAILCLLEQYDKKKEKVSVEMISAKLAYPPNLVCNDLNGLLFNPSFNPKKTLVNGVILTNLENSNDDIDLKTELWLNHEFIANSLKISTIPLILKVSL